MYMLLDNNQYLLILIKGAKILIPISIQNYIKENYDNLK